MPTWSLTVPTTATGWLIGCALPPSGLEITTVGGFTAVGRRPKRQSVPPRRGRLALQSVPPNQGALSRQKTTPLKGRRIPANRPRRDDSAATIRAVPLGATTISQRTPEDGQAVAQPLCKCYE